MSTPPPRAGQTAADVTGRPAGRGRAAPEPYGTARHAAPGPAQHRRGRVNPEETSVVRSSGVMALGTLASRGTGFLRTLVLAYVLGVSAGVSAAYNNANTLPNAVYDLMLGGILTSVVVPLLVNAAKRDSDGGEAYDQRMFTLTTMALAVVTLAATLAAGLLVDLYAHDLTPPVRHLTLIFAFFFIPQIFFYGVSSLAGGVLNARGHFAAPMWTPVINNIVVIAVLLLFVAVGGIGSSGATLTTGKIQLLGLGTTLGIVVQTGALIPFLRRVGFRWHPRFDFRRNEVAEIMRMAAPLFGYILTTQVSFLVVHERGQRGLPARLLRRVPHLQLCLAVVPDAVCDRGHLGDHGTPAADERPCVRTPVRRRQAGLLRWRPAVLGGGRPRLPAPAGAGRAVRRGAVRVRPGHRQPMRGTSAWCSASSPSASSRT